MCHTLRLRVYTRQQWPNDARTWQCARFWMRHRVHNAMTTTTTPSRRWVNNNNNNTCLDYRRRECQYTNRIPTYHLLPYKLLDVSWYCIAPRRVRREAVQINCSCNRLAIHCEHVITPQPWWSLIRDSHATHRRCSDIIICTACLFYGVFTVIRQVWRKCCTCGAGKREIVSWWTRVLRTHMSAHIQTRACTLAISPSSQTSSCADVGAAYMLVCCMYIRLECACVCFAGALAKGECVRIFLIRIFNSPKHSHACVCECVRACECTTTRTSRCVKGIE